MENALKPHILTKNLSSYLNNDRPNLHFSDGIKRILEIRSTVKKIRKEIQHESLANLLIELS